MAALIASAVGFSPGPAPLSARTGEMLAGDTTLHRVYRVRDLSGNNNADDAGETSIYFDSTNQSGIGGTAGSVANP